MTPGRVALAIQDAQSPGDLERASEDGERCIDRSSSCFYYGEGKPLLRADSRPLLPPRSMVGQLTLDQHIGVRIPGGQPIRINNQGTEMSISGRSKVIVSRASRNILCRVAPKISRCSISCCSRFKSAGYCTSQVDACLAKT